jgi:hypothetical protein
LALVAPLVYALARLRLGCGRPAAVLAAVVVVLLPGVAVFGPVATENGLEVVPGLAALLVATSRRWWPFAPVLAALAVGTYTSGLAWAVATLAVVAVAVVREPRRWWQALAGVAAGVGVVVLPLAWWTAGPERIVVGGGRVDDAAGDFALLARLLGVSGESYYYFSALPALGSAVLAVVLELCVLVACARWRAWWPYLAVAGATLALWAVGGNLPGTRRVIALAVVGALAAGVVADHVAARLPGGWRPAWHLAAAAWVCVPLAVGIAGWAGNRPALPLDWSAPPGATMADGFARLDTDLRAGTVTPEQVAADTGDSRSLAMVWLLAERRGDTSDLPSRDQVVGLHYRDGQDG